MLVLTTLIFVFAAAPPANAEPNVAWVEDGEAPTEAGARAPAPAAQPAVERSTRNRPVSLPPPEPRERRPGNGFNSELGVFLGGDDIAQATLTDGSTQTLTAGAGVLFSLGFMSTPVWIGDAVGFGVTGVAAWKYDSIGASNGNLSLSRFPMIAAAHMLASIDDRWFFLLRGGVERDLDVSLSASGIVGSGSVSAKSDLGGLGEIGLYRQVGTENGPFAFSITLRYTSIKYHVAGAAIDASSFGILLSWHANL